VDAVSLAAVTGQRIVNEAAADQWLGALPPVLAP
jgi:hypothetical protein